MDTNKFDKEKVRIPTETPMRTFFDACRDVIAHCPNEYAKSYARAGLGMTDPEEIRTQALYILVNTSRWRGDQARTVKAELKQIGRKGGRVPPSREPREATMVDRSGDEDDFGDRIRDTFYDGRTIAGPWAIMTPDSFRTYGSGLGAGRGQKYEKQADGRWKKVAG